MTITPKIYDLPNFPISGQLFSTPGAVVDGGFTSGGAQVMSPDPGGFGLLEIQPALHTSEWASPFASWLMSKTNGQILRLRLAPTPQVAYSERRDGYTTVTWSGGVLWSNEVEWAGDISAAFVGAVSEGTQQFTVDLTGIGAILQPGHVIGHLNTTYKIDEIEYDGLIATIIPTLPLRRDVVDGSPAYLRPWFTGRINNAADIRALYDAENNGHITPGKIVLNEAIVP